MKTNNSNKSIQFHLKNLFNGIMNDYSIQKYTLYWKDVADQIQKRYKNPIKRNEDIVFEKSLLTAFTFSKANGGKIKKIIILFAKELDINLEEYQSKEITSIKRN